jgi:hypothetical protein
LLTVLLINPNSIDFRKPLGGGLFLRIQKNKTKEIKNDQKNSNDSWRDCLFGLLVPRGQRTSSLGPRHKKDGSK